MNDAGTRVKAREECDCPEERNKRGATSEKIKKTDGEKRHRERREERLLPGRCFLAVPPPDYPRHSRVMGSLLFYAAPPFRAKSIGSADFLPDGSEKGKRREKRDESGENLLHDDPRVGRR